MVTGFSILCCKITGFSMTCCNRLHKSTGPEKSRLLLMVIPGRPSAWRNGGSLFPKGPATAGGTAPLSTRRGQVVRYLHHHLKKTEVFVWKREWQRKWNTFLIMTNQLGKNGQQSCANKNTGVGLGRLLTTESAEKNESNHRLMCTVWHTAHVHNNT